MKQSSSSPYESLGLGSLSRQQGPSAAIQQDDLQCSSCGTPLLTAKTPCPKCHGNSKKPVGLGLSASSKNNQANITTLFSQAAAETTTPPDPQQDIDTVATPSQPTLAVSYELDSPGMALALPSSGRAQTVPPAGIFKDNILSLGMILVALGLIATGIGSFVVEETSLVAASHLLTNVALGLALLGIRHVMVR